ncbi:PREDICTED: basic proline-rich protein-like [Ceratotherium simum simum]|uniref:Basic proline-rich protein-like n=1 Tax=Ceratotherium simum simum TaxID=73337 RepID=A0ABM1CVC2_CERSS|nr:PREDICTED: basic proline-rich protein-like [Ceratotherium simum simum]
MAVTPQETGAPLITQPETPTLQRATSRADDPGPPPCPRCSPAPRPQASRRATERRVLRLPRAPRKRLGKGRGAEGGAEHFRRRRRRRRRLGAQVSGVWALRGTCCPRRRWAASPRLAPRPARQAPPKSRLLPPPRREPAGTPAPPAEGLGAARPPGSRPSLGLVFPLQWPPCPRASTPGAARRTPLPDGPLRWPGIPWAPGPAEDASLQGRRPRPGNALQGPPRRDTPRVSVPAQGPPSSSVKT